MLLIPLLTASHDIFSMRDMRDALGALGPVSGKEPELNNLTVAMTVVDVGDIVFLTSDGISDNFDPVVGKFAMPKKEPETKPGVTTEIEKAVKGGDGKGAKNAKGILHAATSRQTNDHRSHLFVLTSHFSSQVSPKVKQQPRKVNLAQKRSQS